LVYKLEAEFGEFPVELLVGGVEVPVATGGEFVEEAYEPAGGGLVVVNALHGRILSVRGAGISAHPG
jgi:hypothetical protein